MAAAAAARALRSCAQGGGAWGRPGAGQGRVGDAGHRAAGRGETGQGDAGRGDAGQLRRPRCAAFTRGARAPPRTGGPAPGGGPRRSAQRLFGEEAPPGPEGRCEDARTGMRQRCDRRRTVEARPERVRRQEGGTGGLVWARLAGGIGTRPCPGGAGVDRVGAGLSRRSRRAARRHRQGWRRESAARRWRAPHRDAHGRWRCKAPRTGRRGSSG